MKQNFLLVQRLITLTLVCLFLKVSAERKIYDENGLWTGLYNMNPDPNGEIWTAGGDIPLTDEEAALIPEMELAPQFRNRTLPLTVDNTLNPEFRPVFRQIGGSCAQAAGVAYIYTYEINLLRNVPGNVEANQFPYGYTYAFLNRGSSSNGSNTSAGWRILQNTGCPNLSIYGGLNGGLSGTAWMNGYNFYHAANFNRVDQIYTISNLTDPENLIKLKNYLYDHANGSAKGGCAAFSSPEDFDTYTIASGPFAGDKIGLFANDNIIHCMTIAGYSDEIGYDFNNDGRITNDLDVNNDTIVDVRDYEQGAFLVVNSWGTGFGDNGKIWLAYQAITNIRSQSVYYPTVALHEPKLELKVNFTHNSRVNLLVRSGFSSDLSATEPEETDYYGKAFYAAGGSLPLEGIGGDSTIEIGLNVSKYADKFVNGKGKVFLQIESRGGSGIINSLSAMDYTSSSTPTETPCDQSDVPISGTINMGIVVTLNSPLSVQQSSKGIKNSAGLMIRKQGNSFMITLPTSAAHAVKMFTAQGRMVESVLTNSGESQCRLGRNLTRGVYLITAVSAGKVWSTKFSVLD